MKSSSSPAMGAPCPAASRRPVLLAAVLLGITAAASPLAADEGNRFEKQLAPVTAAPVTDWWRSSWQEGWTYQHRGEFSLAASVQIREVKKVNWWQSLVSGAEAFVGQLNLQTKGDSLAESGVLQNRNGEILISRYYPRADVSRAIFRTPVGEPTIVDKLLDLLVDEKTRSGIVKTMMEGLVTATSAVFVPDPTLTTSTMTGMVGTWIGEKADQIITEQFKQNGIVKRPDGGIEIDPRSPLLGLSSSTKDLADVANLAMQLNEAFHRRMFLIRADARSGSEVDTRQIYSEGKDLATVVEMREREGPEKAVGWLKDRMTHYQQPGDLVRGVFQRETFAMSKQIFDSKERRRGDTWEVSAEFFNSFLHPDLKGTFSGHVILHYAGDAKIHDANDESIVFNARKILILFKDEINGRLQESTLRYEEPSGFAAKVQEQTQGFIYVDADSNYIRQAELQMKGETRANLPEMKILEGFEAAGDADLTITYTCKGQPARP